MSPGSAFSVHLDGEYVVSIFKSIISISLLAFERAAGMSKRSDSHDSSNISDVEE